MPLASVLNQTNTNPLWRTQLGSVAMGVTAGYSVSAVATMPVSFSTGIASSFSGAAGLRMPVSVLFGTEVIFTGIPTLRVSASVDFDTALGFDCNFLETSFYLSTFIIG